MYCILVAGIPASGKSTVAKYLSNSMKLPMISKDNIKELLFDELGFQSREEKNKLGRASMKIMYHVAEQMMQTNTAFILENNFEYSSKGELMKILEKYNYTAITVRLTGDYEKIYERFARRDRSPERHRGHVVNDRYPEVEGSAQNTTLMDFAGFMYGIEHRGFDDFIANGPSVVVDSTDFSAFDLEAIKTQIEERITEIEG